MAISRAILGVLLPPAAVCIDKGIGGDLSINIWLLVFTVYIGAIIHAFHVMGVNISVNLLCLFLPPIGAAIEGSISEFCICLILTLLAFVPGVIYAYYVALKHGRSK